MKKILEAGFLTQHGAELREFLYRATLHGFDPNVVYTSVKTPDGVTYTSHFEGDWRYLDEFARGDPFAGIKMVWYKGIACFMMQYSGEILSTEREAEVEKCLRAALISIEPEHPWRGPASYSEHDLHYLNAWEGNIEDFFGEDRIEDLRGTCLYRGRYQGRIVNLR